MKRQRSKLHHYNPRLVLRGFARGGQIATYDLTSGRTYAQSIDRAAAENDFNTLRLNDGSKSDVAEQFFGQEIEGPAADVIDRVLGDLPLDERRDLEPLARFVALQFLRVPRRRAESDALADLLMKMHVATKGPEGIREALAAMEGEQPSDEAVSETWSFLSQQEWRIRLPPEDHVLDTLRMLDDASRVLLDNYDWALTRFQHKQLLTSDAPVVLRRPTGMPAWQGVGLENAASIELPIHRTTCLVLVHKAQGREVHGRELPPTAAHARALNRSVVGNAHARFFHHPDDSLDDLLGKGFEIPEPREISYLDDHASEVINKVGAANTWAFEHPEEPHPLSHLPDIRSLRVITRRSTDDG